MIMDQRIFDQLDMLERGARVETRPTRDAHNISSAEFSAYDAHDIGHDQTANYQQDAHYVEDEFAEQPMTLDSFDEQLLRQPDYNSRHGQAALGQARLSLPPSRPPASYNYRNDPNYDVSMPQIHAQPPAARKLDLSRFSLDNERRHESSSSPYNQPLPSSPTFNLSQRRPAPFEHARTSAPTSRRPYPADLDHSSRYEPLSIEQLEAEERNMQTSQPEPIQDFHPNYAVARPRSGSKAKQTSTPTVQGISLISTHALPDRFRAIFPYPLFNAVQSKTFETIYKTNDNFVLSAPTGSGKTAVLELAVCRLINGFANGSFKIVYQAPTKSLCAERQRDWQAKFGPLSLQCAELTGDTEGAQLRNVQSASIIITTPEKWDSITRKWTDHQKLMQMVKLFLIDEVHILKEDRGATLEAVVSRMKSVGSDVRFVALSATVPNSDDIATWLGKDPMNAHIPAPRERFGEEFRPVRLQKHVCGYPTNSNDFAFEKTLNAKLPEVITRYSQRKPIMVFCFTRGSCAETAKTLANWWATKNPKEKYWSAPRKRITVADKDLRDTISSGVAFHHAGLSIQDRNAIERGYLEGDLNVICCTSTLAVGVNLPCHMVIIKNTVAYQSNVAGGCKEYSDLEIMQMLGRAGRPQFDDSAVAVIMTRQQRATHYEKMLTGQEILESCLHRNLIDHLNAEIGLGTVTSASSAKKWLSGTFLYVRLKDNPEHYKIDGVADGRNLDERLEQICRKGIARLEENDLVKSAPKLQCTEFGDAMARYYLHFDTMKIFLALPPKSKVSEILSAISRAAEFKDIRFRAGEKPTYKELNKNGSIKFPIPVHLDPPAHKVSLIIQSVLGAIEFQTEDSKQRIEYNSAKATIFQHVHRLIRCIIDCQLYLEDAVTTRNALMLARSLGAQVWDDSPLHMKQLEGVGLVYVRKLATAGIKSLEDLEITEAHRIEQILSRNPPFGMQLQDKAKAFPKLRVGLKMMGEPFVKKGEHVTVKIKADIGFLNEKIPETFQRKLVYVCLLAETSDGHKVHFARISAKKLNKGQDVLFTANLTSADQSIRAYVMCDEIAGTMRHAVLRTEIPSVAFPPPKPAEETMQSTPKHNAPNTSKRRSSASKAGRGPGIDSDDFGDEDLDDADLARAEAGGFVDIDAFEETGSEPKRKKQKTTANAASNEEWEPEQLPNGKWACRHTCTDKTSCRHLCCRDGLDKKPKPPKPKESKKATEPRSDPKQTQLNMSTTKKTNSTAAAVTPVAKVPAKPQRKTEEPREARNLNRLHNSVKTNTPKVPTLGHGRISGDTGHQTKSGPPRLSFLEAARGVEEEETMSDYGNNAWTSNDLPEMEALIGTQPASRTSPPTAYSDREPLDDDLFDDMYNEGDHDVRGRLFDENGNNGHVDLSSYADEHSFEQDDDWNFNDLGDDDFGVPLPGTPQKAKARDADAKAKKKSTHLFAGYSTDSVAEDLGLNAGDDDQTLSAAPTTSNPGPTSSKFFAPPKNPNNISRTPSAQLREEAAFFDRVMPADDFLNDVVDAAAAAAAAEPEQDGGIDSPDELEAWFKAEFGTEHFNYVG